MLKQVIKCCLPAWIRSIELKITTTEDLLSQFRGTQNDQKVTSVKLIFVNADSTGSKSELSVDSNVI